MFFFLHNFWRNMSEKEIAAPSSTTRPWGVLLSKNFEKKTCLQGVKRGTRATLLKEKKWEKKTYLSCKEWARATKKITCLQKNYLSAQGVKRAPLKARFSMVWKKDANGDALVA